MTRKLLIALTASAALAAPLAAQAQSTAASTAMLSGEVGTACDIGDPTNTSLEIGDLTGPDGRLLPALRNSATFSTTIQSAWCNAPSILKLDGEPMGLTVVPVYGTPAGFSRLITYNATLSGWPASLVDRPLVGSAAPTTPASEALDADLELVISNLAPLNAAGNAEVIDNVLEAGAYRGQVTVSVAVQ